MNDFLKFATSRGMNSMHVENAMNASASYISPSILEERQLNVTQMDVFSRLMMDRIIFLGTEVNDYTANVIQAQLLYLDSVDSERDMPEYRSARWTYHILSHTRICKTHTREPLSPLKTDQHRSDSTNRRRKPRQYR